MNTQIYYFSGTGNSLYVAQKISDQIENSELVSIPKVIDHAEKIEGDVIGIVSPIYMYNLPYIVIDFIKKIKSAAYIFMVFSGAGELGSGLKETMRLFSSIQLKLSALFNVPMPSNYTPFGVPSEEKQKRLFADFEKRVEDIVKTVQARESYMDGTNTSFFKTHIHPGLLYRLGYSRIKELDKSFTVDDSCNGCSICQKVCPVDNITMQDDMPVWHHQCQQCYACLQWCPTEAIQAGKKTIGVNRYHNPNIKVKDIINSAPQEQK